jgi:hypothetical protein
MPKGVDEGSWFIKMMRIIFERSGGFMGRSVSLNLDLDELPPDQAATLKRLVDESDFFNLTEPPPKKPAADGFAYSLTVNDGKSERTFQLSETNVPNALQPLFENLVARTRKRA